ncbi:hypothetical protein S40293_10148 [Stachybotrys chartarum IBT 40293]|nr:hypothetical protein S40293_10148 [Stachybotrys chartarum IBT 40293]
MAADSWTTIDALASGEKMSFAPSATVIAMRSDVELDTSPSDSPAAPPAAVEVVDASFNEDNVYSLSNDDPACIVGIGCRLPGGIRSPSGLWQFLAQKKSAQGPIYPSRFNIHGFYSPDNNRAGSINADGGYFIQEDVREFENSFFNINNLEAISMDPQQRKLLEVVYECLEDSGTVDISNTNTAVYVGNFTIDFQTMQTRDPDYIHRYSATGSGTAIMANRISYIFDLHGPSFTLDTACSSSLYGLHNAVTALCNKECDGAIVAGANLVTSPEQHLGTGKGGVLSATSTCHTFDEAADGYGRAEAVNAIYLKRLSSALKDGDRIRAVVRGTAVNSNGRTPGITQPSSRYQEAVIQKAYSAAGLRFCDTDYVECHGTGTAVGDPIEVEAIARCFTPRDGSPLLIGAVKTNLGHSEAASGLSAIIKVVLAFEKGVIPPTYGIEKLNPKLRVEERNMKVVAEPEQWPRALQRASINSFGFGGANAHAILESISSYMPFYNADEELGSLADSSDQWVLLPVSAATPKSLEDRYATALAYIGCRVGRRSTDEALFTLASRRKVLYARGFALLHYGDQALSNPPKLVTPVTQESARLPFSFVFSGQGAQYPGMGRHLLERSPVFSQAIRTLDGYLQSLPSDQAPSWTLEQTILDPPETSAIHNVTRSQPIGTAVQIALVQLLRSWGVQAEVSVGHSSGEIAAAYVSGILSARQAILVAYFRGYAVGKLTAQGCMMAVSLTVDRATKLICSMRLEEEVCIACVNSPSSVTLSGTIHGVDILYHALQEQKVFCRKLETGGRAYHSPMMREVGQLYESLLAPYLLDNGTDEKKSGGSAKMYSSVGDADNPCKVFDSDTKLTAKYWRDNLESTVQFRAALETLIAENTTHLIELGPHPALKGPIDQIQTSLKPGAAQLPYSPTLKRNEDAEWSIKMLAGTLYNHGYCLDFISVNNWPRDMRPAHDLPPYPWDYSAGLLWNEPRASIELRNRKYVRHELLGSPQLAHDDISHSWRNILQTEEVPWIRDHKLESQIVFPAAGYLAMAIEAVSQVSGLDASQTNAAYELRDVNIIEAFVLSDKEELGSQPAEIHTSLRRKVLSTSTSSTNYYEFIISSWLAGKATKHCAGTIRLEASEDLDSIMESSQKASAAPSVVSEQWAMAKWYNKLGEEGLCFGPAFRTLSSMETDGKRIDTDAVSTTQLTQRQRGLKDEKFPGTFYPVHPLTIDACVQAAIMGGTGGDLSSLRAHLPVYIARCVIWTPTASSVNHESLIFTKSASTSPATKRIQSTLRDKLGVSVVRMEDVSLSLFRGKSSIQGSNAQRHPFLRISWKPDLSRLSQNSEGSLSNYITSWAETLNLQSPLDTTVASLLDLMGHKNPKMRVLDLSGLKDDELRGLYEGVLDGNSAFPRYRSWTTGELYASGELVSNAGYAGPFDAVVATGFSATEIICNAVAKLVGLVEQNGVIVCHKTSQVYAALSEAGLKVISAGCSHLLALATRDFRPRLLHKPAIILTHAPTAEVADFSTQLKEYLLEHVGLTSVDIVELDDLASTYDDTAERPFCISLLEVERAFLTTMNADEMDRLRRITDAMKDVVWVTNTNTLGGDSSPDMSLISGLSRALMLEQPSLRLSVLDLGSYKALGSEISGRRAFENITETLLSQHEMDDKEFVQKDGLLYISRFTPDRSLNTTFCKRLASVGRHAHAETSRLCDAIPARLTIADTNLFSTIHFQQLREPKTETPAGLIDVDVRAIGMNAKDVYTLNGRVETSNAATAHEFAGVVSSVGPEVSGLEPGDRVLVMAPNHFGTSIRVPARAAEKLLPDEDFMRMVTISVAYTTALYALHDRARLRAGETILIHGGAGAFGTAAIKVAQRIGAIVYTTVSTQVKRDFVASLGIPETHIFHSRTSSFVKDVNKATEGRGVDVIINSLAGELLHDSWDCIAEFGRFIEVGKRELVDAGKLDMRVFLRSATFTAFDISSLFFSDRQWHRDVLQQRYKEVLDLYRTGQIEALPTTVFDAADITRAYRHFSHKDRVGKIVVSMMNPESRIPVAVSSYTSVFDPRKVYLLVGCLGGLGRSLSRWMLTRGARKFVFLGRSGDDKPNAKRIVSLLESMGSDVTVCVVRGDVSKGVDVRTAVEACQKNGPIGGVVQAAMGLHESLFYSMTNEAWQTAVRPKWEGTWNLHRAIALQGYDKDLDFFLLTSSISGTVGTATESNYCAANSFLDAFAKWRREQGKPAVSVGLGMISDVGYLHENPDIEALLLRKGIQPLNEDEFLQAIDLSITEDMLVAHASNQGANAHILTGLEPFGLRDLMARGYEVDNGTLQDPRALLLSAALTVEQDSSQCSTRATPNIVNIPWMKPLAASLAKTLMAEADAESLNAAVLGLIRKRFSSLVLVPLEQVDSQKAFANFGMDSMIAAEFRTWFWNTFNVDVPFLDLLSSRKCLHDLAVATEERLLSSNEK